jgi:gamma-glutamyl-gamma-aminobutyrate hydrolase PuuD
MRPKIGITTSKGALRHIDRYVDYVVNAGGEPIVIVPGEAPPLEELDGVLLSGGADVDPREYGEEPDPTVVVDAERDALELPIARDAIERGLPILGICRGLQVLNVVHGGKLVQHLDDHRTGTKSSDPSAQHPVRVETSSELGRILGKDEVPVNSRHHQAVRQDELAPGLRPTAWSEDGVIEGLERTDGPWVVAVQWHPERVDECDPACRRLAEALVAQAREHRQSLLPLGEG